MYSHKFSGVWIHKFSAHEFKLAITTMFPQVLNFIYSYSYYTLSFSLIQLNNRSLAKRINLSLCLISHSHYRIILR